nr:exodeoxyribonuclease VII large subunit [uncultured Desulfobulbus sp.]
MDERKIFTVSQLNSAIRSLLESKFPFIHVAGEISNLHRPYSGHNYFTLKDSGAQIKAVLFKTQQRYLSRPIKEGDQVVCRGRISVYEPRGDYQLIVDTVEYQGAGALQQAYEQLKRKLALEGLFDEHTKRPLPRFPEHIGLITSPQGAAVHDFIRIATRRWPQLRISILPVSVQGTTATGDMIQALTAMNTQVHPDVIVLCRGGGSIEDLWAFNDEDLARSIRASKIPIVSGVGHEIDFTIADFAADLRAPTPSGAAELLTPDMQPLKSQLNHAQVRLGRSLSQQVGSMEQRLQLFRQRLDNMARPLDQLSLTLDHLSARLHNGLKQRFAYQQQRVESAMLQLTRQNPAHRLLIADQRLGALLHRLQQSMRQRLQEEEDRFGRAAGILQAVSPLATLARGYAIIRTTTKRPRLIRRASELKRGAKIEVMLGEGQLLCQVEEIDEG